MFFTLYRFIFVCCLHQHSPLSNIYYQQSTGWLIFLLKVISCDEILRSICKRQHNHLAKSAKYESMTSTTTVTAGTSNPLINRVCSSYSNLQKNHVVVLNWRACAYSTDKPFFKMEIWTVRWTLSSTRSFTSTSPRQCRPQSKKHHIYAAPAKVANPVWVSSINQPWQ